MRDLLTETEAATKECRAVPPIMTKRMVPPAAPTTSKTVESMGPLSEVLIIEFHKCSASKCGHWRWSEHVKNDTSTGFCGLAGLPKYL